ncbi:glycosyltransferase family 4 protein [Oceanobacillus sp. J11TS1]|uniref:glycosyltransferase family 4 protein n=1 Tax=Oceanobacillus sp. J11TS1 TaxID=2807191 RepID=UPI001AFDED84|nr:MraY family glycosyltransferase [Oceanobacillus sp. J11TS1]GIO23414.1 undecaprenyl-phosphate alpha-N-acetylglucosaminyl 1-phosphate transferase [Oceanobacillus sp. J11TS1]
MIQIAILSMTSLIAALIVTPIVIKYSKKLHITDKPNARKVHQEPIPTLGGIAIAISFIIGLLVLQPTSDFHAAIIIGAGVILILGIFDDIYDLPAKFKFFVQFLVACLVVFWGGLQVEFINLPFGGELEFGLFSEVFTILWIVGITNAINLIDGLDGLAAGVSGIALLTITGMAMLMGDVYVTTMAMILLFSILGFLRYNFHPAKIFMGDTGALFLGFMISVLSLLGFKNVTVVSFLIPIFILGVPISDTLIAMIRRKVNNRPVSSPDSAHLHHRLIQFGFSHKQTVLFIYLLSTLFSVTAILFSMTTLWGSMLILCIVLFAITMLVDALEMITSEFKPFTNLFKRTSDHRHSKK